MHFCHKRAGRVNHFQFSFGRLVADGWRDTVCAEHDGRSLRDVGNILDENHAPRFKAFHNMLVMNDCVTNIQRRAVNLQGEFNNFDGVRNSGAKTSRRGENQLIHLFTMSIPAKKNGPTLLSRAILFAI